MIGTYVGLRLHPTSRRQVLKYIVDSKITSVPTDIERRLHVTLIYSRRHLKKFQPMGGCFYRAQCSGFDLFDNSYDANKKCLVMTLDCDSLMRRNKLIMAAHNATEDFPYSPHITLTYDASGIDVEMLKPYKEEILLIEEYSENIDLDDSK